MSQTDSYLTLCVEERCDNDYNKITNKLSILSQNVIQLKAIEPKLTPDKVIIKEYSKKTKDFAWIDDFAKKETSKLNLIDETKELSKLTKIAPDIANILPSNIVNITNEEILEIIMNIVQKDKTIKNKDKIINSLNKLKIKDNAKKFIDYLDKKYDDKDSKQEIEKISILIAISQNINSELIIDTINTRDYVNKNAKATTAQIQAKKQPPSTSRP